ncbi:hypothetical protein [Actinospica sp.]|uniref:hypothetical protein n=1 Tax=Actinospica sp. TaxID=1872142 RepID=UPI002BF24CEC|nr:hypothetical protein [Actinospica sp.]HWG27208.1 hypothetical protein [Actinospica sp.]
MGTGFSLDPNEYHAAANVIEGYGAMQADHGATLSAGTSTPLSSSGTGISGAISQIAMGTVQKIVTDVTSTTKGFADDTAKGLRTQADNVSQLETELAGRSKSILSDAQSSLLGGGYAMSGYAMSGLSSATSSPLTSYGSGGMPGTFSSPMTSAPLSESSPGEADLSAPGSGESALSGAGAVAQEESQQASTVPFGQMHGSTGAASAAGSAEERGQRPDYLKSKTELSDTGGDRVKAAIDGHLKECGMAPIPLGPSRLVCAKCGSMLEIDDAQALTA